jgi:hypothetical protein
MAIKRIAIVESNHHRPLAIGEKAPEITEVNADVRGDYAVFYDDWHEHWSVTHVPTGLSICRAPTKTAAMAVRRALQPLRLTCTYDDTDGLQWPDRAAEVELVVDVLRQFEWYRKQEKERVP